MLATLALMMVNLSLTLYKYVQWRLTNPYIGISILAIVLLAIVWVAAWYYDRRLKLWREQMMVAVDRNPYAQDRLSPKETINMEWIWIPLVSKADPMIAELLKTWVKTEMAKYPDVQAQVDEIKRLIQ
jgi:ABC-type Fe3+ transport system permease subunit